MPAYDLKSLCRIKEIKLSHHRAAADSKAAAELSLLAFDFAGVNTFDDFPNKLMTSLGNLSAGGYTPSRSNSSNFYIKNKNLKTIVGDPSKHNPESIFYGKNVVFTGTLSSMSRSAAFQCMADIGGILSNNVNKKTDFLIVGQQDFKIVGDDGMSNKQEKAVDLIANGVPIEILSEDEFLRSI